MIDQTFTEQERATFDPERPADPEKVIGSMKTMLEDQAAASLHAVETRIAGLRVRAYALSEALRNVRIARAEGTIADLDRAMAELRATVEGAW